MLPCKMAVQGGVSEAMWGEKGIHAWGQLIWMEYTGPTRVRRVTTHGRGWPAVGEPKQDEEGVHVGSLSSAGCQSLCRVRKAPTWGQ